MCRASICAASLPLGSINPKSSSFIVRVSPGKRQADVPITSVTLSSISTYEFRSNPIVSARLRTV
jgi:hypothetical protein